MLIMMSFTRSYIVPLQAAFPSKKYQMQYTILLMMVKVFQVKPLKHRFNGHWCTKTECTPWYPFSCVPQEVKYSNLTLSSEVYGHFIITDTLWYGKNYIIEVRTFTYCLRPILSDLWRTRQLPHTNHDPFCIAWHCSVTTCISIKEMLNEFYQCATIHWPLKRFVIGMLYITDGDKRVSSQATEKQPH